MMKTNKPNSPRLQRGVSLPVALILLVPLTLLGVTLANRNNLEEMMAASERDGQQSLMNAESGLAMGQQVMEQVVSGDYAYTIDDILSPDSQNGVVSYDGTALTDYSLTEGTVTVVVVDNVESDGDLTVDTDGHVILRSTGEYNSGERVVEAIVELVFDAGESEPGADPETTPPLTIFTEDYIKINGNPDIYGPGSLVHSNAYVDIDGTTRIAGEIQQVSSNRGDRYYQANDGVWGDWDRVRVTTDATRIQTPYIFPPIYKSMATRYMAADCKIYDGAPDYTNPLTGATSKQIGYGKDGFDDDNWVCDHDGSKNKKWELKGDVTPGFYYVEGNLIINGDMGSSNNPQVISIVTEGYLEISGNPYIKPYYDTQVNTVGELGAASTDARNSIDPDLTYNEVLALDAVFLSDEVLLLAGGDLNIQGDPSSNNYNFNGVMAAHDQFTISGNPRLNGGIIAENAKYTSSSFFFGNIDSGERKADHITMNEISGNPDIYGSMELGAAEGEPEESEPSETSANFVGWREVIQ